MSVVLQKLQSRAPDIFKNHYIPSRDEDLYYSGILHTWAKLNAEQRENTGLCQEIILLSPFLFGCMQQVQHNLKNWLIDSNLIAMPLSHIARPDQWSVPQRNSMMRSAELVLSAWLALGPDARNPKARGVQKDVAMMNTALAILRLNADYDYNTVTGYISSYKPLQNALMSMVARPTPETVLALFYAYASIDIVKCYENPDFIDDFEGERLKEEGTRFYKAKEYNKAISLYSKGIAKNPLSYVLYGNRAQAYLELEKFREAEWDACRAVLLKPDWSKGVYRFALSLIKQSRFRIAEKLLIQFKVQDFVDSANAGELEKLLKSARSGDPMLNTPVNNKNIIFGPTGNNGFNGPKQTFGDFLDKHSYGDSPKNGPSSPIINSVDFNPPKKPQDAQNKRSRSSTPVSTNNNNTGRNVPAPGIMKADPFIEPQPVINPQPPPSPPAVMKDLCSQASSAAIDGLFMDAIAPFKKALADINTKGMKIFRLEEMEVVVLKYCYAISCIYSNQAEKMDEAFRSLEEILEDHSTIAFPLVYYAQALAYLKQNRFKEALEPIRFGLTALEKHVRVQLVTWPGTRTKIEESQTGKLQNLLDTMQDQCTCPPPAVANCRLDACPAVKSAIYCNDLGFKGYIQITCNDLCVIQYHIDCWKIVKDNANIHNDKDHLGINCHTPDCGSQIGKIEIFKADGFLKIDFIHEEYEKRFTKRPKREKKLEKKLAQREEKKIRKTEAKTKPVFVDYTETSSETSEKPDSIDERRPLSECDGRRFSLSEDLAAEFNLPKPSSVKTAPLHNPDEPAPIATIPLHDSDDEMRQESVKQKSQPQHMGEKKRKDKKVVDINTFVGEMNDDLINNEYLLRLKRLQQEREMVEEREELPPPPADYSAYSGGVSHPFIRQYISPTLAQEEFPALENKFDKRKKQEKLQNVRENLNEYLLQFFQANGPMDADDPRLQEDVSGFPSEARAMIENAGGLRAFLLHSKSFYCRGNLICALGEPSEKGTFVVQETKAAYAPRDTRRYSVPKETPVPSRQSVSPPMQSTALVEVDKQSSKLRKKIKKVIEEGAAGTGGLGEKILEYMNSSANPQEKLIELIMTIRGMPATTRNIPMVSVGINTDAEESGHSMSAKLELLEAQISDNQDRLTKLRNTSASEAQALTSAMEQAQFKCREWENANSDLVQKKKVDQRRWEQEKTKLTGEIKTIKYMYVFVLFYSIGYAVSWC